MATVSDTQRQILTLIKECGTASTALIAERLGISYEAVRQQLRPLQASGLIEPLHERLDAPRQGRPTVSYSLSPAGEHLFPKAYDQLAVVFIDKLSASLGKEALRRVLAAITEENVQLWEPRLRNLPLKEKLDALKGFYLDEDPHTEVQREGDELRLVERNCPFLNVALRRPALCSVTVSTLSRLLGYRIRREESFQRGHGRCAFRLLLDQPLADSDFVFEFEDDPTPNSS